MYEVAELDFRPKQLRLKITVNLSFFLALRGFLSFFPQNPIQLRLRT